jgi:alpha-galactosidase
MERDRNAMSERAEPIIEAIVQNAHAYEEAVNIPNRGYIRNLPENAMVEVPASSTPRASQDSTSERFPGRSPRFAAARLTIVELNVEALVKRDRNLVRQPFSIDPMIQDLQVGERLADACLQAYQDLLPEFL